MGELDISKRQPGLGEQKRRMNRKRDLRFDDNRRRFKSRKKKSKAREWNLREMIKWIIQIGLVSSFAFMLVWFFGQRVSNAGEAMKPVLNNGDVVLVDRLVYNARKPGRGDIIAFRPNGNENAHFYVKRIVGLPGETVEIKEESVYIDGEKTTNHVYAKGIKNPGVAKKPVKLKEDEYFVMGDNHESSDDSRMADIGNVKRSTIYGRVWFVASMNENFGFVKR